MFFSSLFLFLLASKLKRVPNNARNLRILQIAFANGCICFTLGSLVSSSEWCKKKTNKQCLLCFPPSACLNRSSRLLQPLTEDSLFQDCSIREKIDLEIRMREGIWKLLSLSTKKDQVLHAVKNLMVCSARIQAYTAELQKSKEEIANQTGARLVL